MLSKNDITGDNLITKLTNDDYRTGWDRIFNKPPAHEYNSMESIHEEAYNTLISDDKIAFTAHIIPVGAEFYEVINEKGWKDDSIETFGGKDDGNSDHMYKKLDSSYEMLGLKCWLQYWIDGTETIEKSLKYVSAPFSLDHEQAELWVNATRSAYIHALEMMGVPRDDIGRLKEMLCKKQKS